MGMPLALHKTSCKHVHILSTYILQALLRRKRISEIDGCSPKVYSGERFS